MIKMMVRSCGQFWDVNIFQQGNKFTTDVVCLVLEPQSMSL